MGVQPFLHLVVAAGGARAAPGAQAVQQVPRSRTSRATRTCARSARSDSHRLLEPRARRAAAAPTRRAERSSSRRGRAARVRRDARCVDEGERASQRPVFYRPVGCEACAQTGYRGRIGIYELLVIDDAVRKEILNNSDSNDDHARRGMRAACARCARTARARCSTGVTSIEEVLAATQAGRAGVSHGRLRVARHQRRGQGRQGHRRRRQPARRCASRCAREGILVTQLEEESVARTRDARDIDFRRLLPRVSLTDLALTTRQLATLLKAGVPLVEALDALIEQIEKDELRNALTNARQGQRGHRLQRRAAARTPRSSATCT